MAMLDLYIFLILIICCQCTTVVVPSQSSASMLYNVAPTFSININTQSTVISSPIITPSLSIISSPTSSNNSNNNNIGVPSLSMISSPTSNNNSNNNNIVVPSLSMISSPTSNNNSNNNNIVIPSLSIVPMTSSTTNQPATTMDTTCFLKEDWDPDFFRYGKECLTAQCNENMLKGFELYLKCNGWERPEELQVISYRISEYLLLRAKFMISEKGFILDDRIADRAHHKHFYTEYGFLRKSFFRSFYAIEFDFRDYGIQDRVFLPPTALEEEVTAFQVTIYENIYRETDMIKYQKEITALREALETLPDDEAVAKKDVLFMLNSKIMTFAIDPPKTQFRDYIMIRLYLRDPRGTTNHRCVRMIGDMEYWTDSSCYPHLVTDNYVECFCDSFEGRYAILSDEATEPPEPETLDRNMLTDILVIVALGGIGAAIASQLLPYMLKCSHLGGMLKIYKVGDFTFAIYCTVFLIGVLKSDDVKTAKLLAAALHFLHHASITWILAEGVHLYHEMSPLYSDAVGMLFFYSTFAFGGSAALAGAAMGYDYEFSGETQYIWPYATGGDVLYMFIPTVGVILLQVSLNLLLVYELMSWIGTKYDYLYSRSVKFIKRSTGYTLVFSGTHFLGVSSMQQNGMGAFSYLFLGFFTIQVMCIFFHHCFSNIECWLHREMEEFAKELAQIKKLEEEMGKKNVGYSSSDAESSDDDNDDGSENNDKMSKKDYAIINIDPEARHPENSFSSQQFMNNSQNPLIRSTSEDTLYQVPNESNASIRQSPTLPVEESSDSVEPDMSEKTDNNDVGDGDKNENNEQLSNAEEEEQATDDTQNENEQDNQPADEPQQDNQPSDESQQDNQPADEPQQDNQPADEPQQDNGPADEAEDKEERPPSQCSIASTVSNKSTAPESNV